MVAHVPAGAILPAIRWACTAFALVSLSLLFAADLTVVCYCLAGWRPGAFAVLQLTTLLQPPTHCTSTAQKHTHTYTHSYTRHINIHTQRRPADAAGVVCRDLQPPAGRPRGADARILKGALIAPASTCLHSAFTCFLFHPAPLLIDERTCCMQRALRQLGCIIIRAGWTACSG